MSKDILYPLRRLHGRMHDTKIEKKQAKLCRDRIKNADADTLMFVLTPTHGNLGDHAIAKAVIVMLNELNAKYMEVTTNELVLLEKFGMLKVMNGHPILVNGGGNLGTLWPKVERVFRAVITSNPDSKIICLPNTIFYEQSEAGEREMELSKRIYNAHPSLKLCARERISYEFMKPVYNDVVLVPDMVLSLNESKENTDRSGCLLCLRKDIEKTRSDDEEQAVLEQVRQMFGDRVSDSDMVIAKPVPIEQRETELEKKFDEFRHAELVVTDRLHGMLFCAITGTPCIVINSKSPKVKGCYEWIKNLEYIKFAEDVNDIGELYRKIPRKWYVYSPDKLQSYYEKLKRIISEICNNT